MIHVQIEMNRAKTFKSSRSSKLMTDDKLPRKHRPRPPRWSPEVTPSVGPSDGPSVGPSVLTVTVMKMFHFFHDFFHDDARTLGRNVCICGVLKLDPRLEPRTDPRWTLGLNSYCFENVSFFSMTFFMTTLGPSVVMYASADCGRRQPSTTWWVCFFPFFFLSFPKTFFHHHEFFHPHDFFLCLTLPKLKISFGFPTLSNSNSFISNFFHFFQTFHFIYLFLLCIYFKNFILYYFGTDFETFRCTDV